MTNSCQLASSMKVDVNIEIKASKLDGKMCAIFTGRGGAACQCCFASHTDILYTELVVQGFRLIARYKQ